MARLLRLVAFGMVVLEKMKNREEITILEIQLDQAQRRIQKLERWAAAVSQGEDAATAYREIMENDYEGSAD